MAYGNRLRLIWLFSALIFLLSSCVVLPAQTAGATVSVNPSDVTRRALYVACDYFLSQVDTWPSSRNNVKAVGQALSGGNMSFARQDTQYGISTVAGLAQAIRDAFGEADASDVSYFYISTHGKYDAAKPNLEAGLLLSDGKTEETVTARQLEEAFSVIKGTKVLIIDACNSGAFIGKGVSGGATGAAFLGPDYKVLTSAGGSEESWYWSKRDKNNDAVQGASYFSSALTDGLGYHGEYGADLNRDGQITLTECYNYLLENHAASTPQCYPQDDGFVLLSYDRSSVSLHSQKNIITGITFYDTVLDIRQSSISFEFTAVRPVQMAYHLVYYQDGKWQFANAEELKYDDQEVGGDFGDQKGAISAGRKLRTLELAPQGEDTYGYVMIQLVTQEGDKTTLHGSRVLCVPPISGDPELSVKADAALDVRTGRELSILVSHKYPCLLSVSILNENGKTVRRLASYQPTRPQQLTPPGSFFYWNGKLEDGSTAPPGKYTVKVTAHIGDVPYEATSEPFELLKAE